jgi:hypothetical protein
MIKTLAIIALTVTALGLGACASKQSQPVSQAPASVGYSK